MLTFFLNSLALLTLVIVVIWTLIPRIKGTILYIIFLLAIVTQASLILIIGRFFELLLPLVLYLGIRILLAWQLQGRMKEADSRIVSNGLPINRRQLLWIYSSIFIFILLFGGLNMVWLLDWLMTNFLEFPSYGGGGFLISLLVVIIGLFSLASSRSHNEFGLSLLLADGGLLIFLLLLNQWGSSIDLGIFSLFVPAFLLTDRYLGNRQRELKHELEVKH